MPRPLTAHDLTSPPVLTGVRDAVTLRLEQRPSDPGLLLQLVRIHRALGELDAAARACARYLATHGSTAEISRLHRVLVGNPSRATPASEPTPVPFLSVRDVLSSAEQAAFWTALEALRDRLEPSAVKWEGGRGVDASVRHSLRAPAGAAVRRLLLPKARATIVEHRLVEALGISGQLADDRVEAEVVAHLGGGCFGAHTDDGYGHQRRLLSCVYYLHRRPRGFSGGDLLLHDLPGLDGANEPVSFTRILPDDNSAVFFAADVRHEVLPVTSDRTDPLDGRVSVNLWFHGTRP